MKQEIKIGGWVNSYSKGIYRIEKIIDNFYDESSPVLDGNKIGDKMKDRTIISKRLLNSKFKKSISYESCSDYFVTHLDNQQMTELQKILADNPKFLIELENYQIPTLTAIYNSDLKIDNDTDLQTTLQLISFMPFVWQIYPQRDDAHHAKLAAFLNAVAAPVGLRDFHLRWNGIDDRRFVFPDLPAWGTAVQIARNRLLRQIDLTERLLALADKASPAHQSAAEKR